LALSGAGSCAEGSTVVSDSDPLAKLKLKLKVASIALVFLVRRRLAVARRYVVQIHLGGPSVGLDEKSEK
jgi:hypothetical protein